MAADGGYPVGPCGGRNDQPHRVHGIPDAGLHPAWSSDPARTLGAGFDRHRRCMARSCWRDTFAGWSGRRPEVWTRCLGGREATMHFVAWHGRSRRRVTVGGLMALVALTALMIDALRPPSLIEAERIAAWWFDPSGRWEGHFRARARSSF